MKWYRNLLRDECKFCSASSNYSDVVVIYDGARNVLHIRWASIFKRLAKKLFCPFCISDICVRVHPSLKSSIETRLSLSLSFILAKPRHFGEINETHERLSRREYRRGYCGMRSECKCRGCDKRPAALSSYDSVVSFPQFFGKFSSLQRENYAFGAICVS